MAEPNQSLTLREYYELEKKKAAVRHTRSATLGGPRPEEPPPPTVASLIGARRVPTPDPGSALRTGAEIVGSTVAAGPAGGLARVALGRTALSPFTQAALGLLARSAGAGAGGLGASELLAPGDETTDEEFLRQSEAFILGAGGQAAGEGLFAGARALKKLVRPTASRLTEKVVPGAEEAQAIIRSATDEAGVPMRASLTPGQMRKGWVATLENVAEAGFLGSRISQEHAHAARAAEITFRKSIQEFGDALDHEALGSVLSDAISGANEVARAATQAAYSAVDVKLAQVARAQGMVGATPGVVDLSPVYRDMQKKLLESATAGDTKAKAILKVLKRFSVDIDGNVELVGFKRAEAVRQVLLSISRPTEGDLLPGVRALAKSAAAQVDNQIQVAGLRLGPAGQDVLNAYAVARAASRTQHEVFGNEMVGALLRKASPEQISEALFRDNRPSSVKKVREIIFDPRYSQGLGRSPNEVWGEVQSSYLATKVHGAKGSVSGAGYGQLSGEALRKELEKAGGTWSEVFPDPVQRKRLMDNARALELAQSHAPGKSFRVILALSQGTAALRTAQWALGVGPAQPGAGQQAGNFAILLGPNAIARVLTSPLLRPALLSLTKASATKAPGIRTRLASQASVRLVHAVGESGVPFTFRDENGVETQYPEGLSGGAANPWDTTGLMNKLANPPFPRRINTGR